MQSNNNFDYDWLIVGSGFGGSIYFGEPDVTVADPYFGGDCGRLAGRSAPWPEWKIKPSQPADSLMQTEAVALSIQLEAEGSIFC